MHCMKITKYLRGDLSLGLCTNFIFLFLVVIRRNLEVETFLRISFHFISAFCCKQRRNISHSLSVFHSSIATQSFIITLLLSLLVLQAFIIVYHVWQSTQYHLGSDHGNARKVHSYVWTDQQCIVLFFCYARPHRLLIHNHI